MSSSTVLVIGQDTWSTRLVAAYLALKGDNKVSLHFCGPSEVVPLATVIDDKPELKQLYVVDANVNFSGKPENLTVRFAYRSVEPSSHLGDLADSWNVAFNGNDKPTKQPAHVFEQLFATYIENGCPDALLKAILATAQTPNQPFVAAVQKLVMTHTMHAEDGIVSRSSANELFEKLDESKNVEELGTQLLNDAKKDVIEKVKAAKAVALLEDASGNSVRLPVFGVNPGREPLFSDFTLVNPCFDALPKDTDYTGLFWLGRGDVPTITVRRNHEKNGEADVLPAGEFAKQFGGGGNATQAAFSVKPDLVFEF
jgi:hypothetical protein